MNESELFNLSVLIREHFPATTDGEGEIALKVVKGFDFATAKQAVTDLRMAMPSHQKRVDGQRLGAICQRMTAEQTQTPAARRAAAEQQAEANRRRLESERMVAAADFARLDKEIADKAELRAKAEKNVSERLFMAWAKFSDASRKRLVDIELAGMK